MSRPAIHAVDTCLRAIRAACVPHFSLAPNGFLYHMGDDWILQCISIDRASFDSATVTCAYCVLPTYCPIDVLFLDYGHRLFRPRVNSRWWHISEGSVHEAVDEMCSQIAVEALPWLKYHATAAGLAELLEDFVRKSPDPRHAEALAGALVINGQVREAASVLGEAQVRAAVIANPRKYEVEGLARLRMLADILDEPECEAVLREKFERQSVVSLRALGVSECKK